MTNYIIIFLIIILSLIIIYSINRNFKKYIYRTRESFNIGDIKKAIKSVGKFGSDIGNLGNQLGEQIGKVGDLGKEIRNLGPEIAKIATYPVELGNKLANEVTDIANKAEDFIVDQFDKVKDEVVDVANDVSRFATDSLGVVRDQIEDIGDVIEDIPSQVVNLANDIFGKYIPWVFEEGWKYFKRYVIDPIVDFFRSIGGVFEIIGDIFVEIFDVLIRTPSCIPIYLYDASIALTIAFLKTVLPGWLKDIIRGFHNNITKPILIPAFNFIMGILKTVFELIGFNFKFDAFAEKKRKCYDFGPLKYIIKAFEELFELIMMALNELFKIIPIDLIINEILKLFGLGKKKKGGIEKPIPGAQAALNNVQKMANEAAKPIGQVISSASQITSSIHDQAKSAIESTGINVAMGNIPTPRLPTPPAVISKLF